MNKKLIRLTEADLHRIVRESVNNVLTELDWKTYASAAEKSYEPGPMFQTYSKPNEKPNRNERSRRFMKAAEDALNRDYGYEKEYKSGNKGSLRFTTPHNRSDMDYDDDMRNQHREKAHYVASKDYTDGGRLSYVGPRGSFDDDEHSYIHYRDKDSSWGYRLGKRVPTSDIYKGDKKFRDAVNTADDELRNFKDGNYKYDSIKDGGEGKWIKKR